MSEINIEDFGEDVEKEIINCKSCNSELLILEHSPFEDGYYLYCDSCPLRVDISIYDSEYQRIEETLKSTYPNFEEREDYFNLLYSEIEKKLEPCECGGKYSSQSVIRCLNCGERIHGYKDYMNVWYLKHFHHDCPENEIKKYVKEPNWKNGNS